MFRDRLDFDGGAVASPLVFSVLTAMAEEATAADAVTGETIAATDGDDVVFFLFFFLFVVVHGAIFRGVPCFRFSNHPVINPLSCASHASRASRLPITFLGIVGGFSVSL